MDTFVAAAGIVLAVREFGGSGTPVLLLHGAGNTLADMAPLAACLSTDHRVVGMDLRNHGRSGDGPWTWDAVLDDVRIVIERLELARPLLVGHSLGGMIAAMYADRYTGTAGAVNLDGYGTGQPDQFDMDADAVVRLLEQLRAVTDEAIVSLTTPQTPEQASAGRAAWIDAAQAQGFDPELAAEVFDRPLAAGPDGTFSRRPVAARLAQLRECIDTFDIVDLYRQTTTPQLVFLALRDQPDPSLSDELLDLTAARRRWLAAELQRIATARSNVHVVELDATHGLIYEQPQLIADRVRAFAAVEVQV